MLEENNKKDKSWYLESGQGMGKTLLIANNKEAYTLSDRSTWMTFNQKNKLKILVGNIVTTISDKKNYLYRPV